MPKSPHYDQEEGGLSTPQVVHSAYGAYANACLGCGREEAPWGDADEEVRAAFANAVAQVLPAIEAAEGVRFTDLAGQLYLIFWRSLGVEPRDFGEEPPAATLPWVAAVRHLANCLTGFDDEPDTDPASHEAHWREWAAGRLAGKGEVGGG